MLPIILDGSMIRAGIAGLGDSFARRLAMMKEGGIEQPEIFSGHLPDAGDIARLQILFVAGLDAETSRSLAQLARAAGVLVNVEDVPELCDFHVPAQVRRGNFLIAISTAGESPALSRALREKLEVQFGPEWEQRLDELAELRRALRARGVRAEEVSARTRAHLAEQGWLE